MNFALVRLKIKPVGLTLKLTLTLTLKLTSQKLFLEQDSFQMFSSNLWDFATIFVIYDRMTYITYINKHDIYKVLLVQFS